MNKVSTEIQVGVSGNVAATALNSRNQVVGSVYGDGCCSASSGFIYLNGTATLVNYPAQTMTYLYGINDSGVTVGVYMPTGQGAQGFLYNSGTFTQVGYPDLSLQVPRAFRTLGLSAVTTQMPVTPTTPLLQLPFSKCQTALESVQLVVAHFANLRIAPDAS